jgi:translocation and assembly module TamB
MNWNWKRMVKPTVRALALGAGAAVLFLLLAFGIAQTEKGRGWVSSLLARALSRGTDMGFEVGRLEGLVPFRVRLDRLTARDDAGPLFHAEDLALHWSPGALLEWRLQVKELSAALVRIDRLPESKGKAPSTGKGLPKWPRGLPRLRVEHFAIARIELGEAVLGESVLMRTEGRLAVAPEGRRGRLSFLLERMDGPTFRVAAKATVDGDPPSLSLRVEAEEAKGGLVATILGVPGPLALSLRGEGPLRAWTGRLQGSLAGLGDVEATIGLEDREEIKLTMEGKAGIAHRLLPGALAPWLGKTVRFVLRSRLGEEDALVVDGLTLETGRVTAELNGSLDRRWENVEARFRMKGADLSPLAHLTGAPVTGSVQVEGSVSGPLFQPEGRASLKLEGVTGPEFGFGRGEGDFKFRCLGPLAPAFPGVHVEGRGAVQGLAIHGYPLSLDTPITWSLAAEGPTEETMEVQEFTLAGHQLALTAAGRIDIARLRGEMQAQLEVGDLRRFSKVVGFDLPATVRLEARAEGDGRTRNLFAQVSGKLSLLEGSPTLAFLRGRELSYAGTIRLQDGRKLSLSDLRLDAGEATLTGNGSLDMDREWLEGSWQAVVTDLARLSPAVRRSLEGSLEIKGKVTGPLARLKLQADATSTALHLQGARFRQAHVLLNAEGLPSRTRGRLTLELDREAQRVTGETLFALAGDRLGLTGIVVSVGKNRLDGSITMDLARKLVDGNVQGRFRDLAELGSLVGEEVSGTGDITARFAAVRDDQQMNFTGVVRDLGSRHGTVRKMEVEGRLQQLFQRPRGAVHGELTDSRLQDLAVTALSLKAEGDGRRLTVSAEGSGRFRADFQISASGDVVTAADTFRIELNRLRGRYGDLPVGLARAAALVRGARGYTLDSLTLNVGTGEVTARGTLGEEPSNLSVTLTGMPLRVLRLAGLPDLAGTATGSLRLEGSPLRPVGKADLRIDGLAFADQSLPGLGPIQLTARATLEGGRVESLLRVYNAGPAPVEVALEIPVDLSLSPLACSLPAQGQVAGRVRGEMNVALINALLALEDQEFKGKLRLDLTLGGKVGAPVLSGQAHLEQGAYENFRTGTMLRNVQLLMTAKTPRLILERGRADDGERGTVTAEGWLDLVPRENFPFKVGLRLEQVTVLRGDKVTAAATGKATLSGSFAEALLDGGLRVGPAEIRIPERLPPGVATLEVVEVHGAGAGRALPANRAQEPPFDLRLALALESPGRVFVRGRGLDSEWEGDLRVTGRASEPAVTGTLSLVRGRFDFPGRPFTLTQGLITFYGRVPEDGTVSLAGVAQTPLMVANLKASGPLTSPTIDLTSEPPQPKEEILAHLLFGQGTARLTPLQAAQLADAASSLAGSGGSGDFMAKVRRLVGIDQLQFKQAETKEGAVEPSVAAGKYLLEGVYLEVEKGTEPTSGKASVQVEVMKNITVGTEVGVNNQGGVSLNWRFDY